MSLDSFQAQSQAPIGRVATREPVPETTRKLPEVEGKGKGIAMDELAAQYLLDLHKPKRRSEDISHTVALEEKTAELDEDQARSDPRKTPEFRPPPQQDLMEEDQAGSDPGKSHVALAGPNSEPMHDNFVATVYPRIHESLKHATKEQVHLENPLSSSGTLSSMKNLDNFNFGDQFVNDNPTTEDPGKTNMETKVESMVTVLIHQTSFSAHPLSTLVIDLTSPKPVSSTIEEQDKTSQSSPHQIFKLELRDLPHKIDQTINEVVKEAVHVALQAPLRDRFRELPEADMKEILHQRMFESGSYKSLPEHVALYEALEASMEHENGDEFLAEKDKSRKRRHDDQDPPQPPPPESDQRKKTRHDSDASASKQPQKKTIPPPYLNSPIDMFQHTDDVHILDSEETGAAHLPKVKPRAEWLKPVPEEEGPKTPELDWVIPANDLLEPENNWANALANRIKIPRKTSYFRRQVIWVYSSNDIANGLERRSSTKLIWKVDLVNPEGHRIVPDVSKPLPLGGPPGQVTIQPQFFFNKDMEYLVSGDKERRSALSISKLKEANYLDFGLEELVLSLWIKSECEYDISAAYGITHWWFKRKEFYITRHSAPSNRRVVRFHMRILSISEADFKNLHPNDFEDLYLLHIQGKLNHLPGFDKIHLFNAVKLWIRNLVIRQRMEDLQLGIESYQTKLNITQPRWDALDFQFKEDYTIVSKPRAVIYKDRNDQKKMIRENEVHKFSDGTLQRVLKSWITWLETSSCSSTI
ncbi:hypothetical protein Tco_1219794 [Tanacetum coccineum]